METQSKSRGGLILGGLMIAIASFLVGGYGGSQVTASYLLNQSLGKHARDVESQVRALQQLQAGDQSSAMELMESRLDDDLVLLDPQEPYEGLSDATQSAITMAISQARDYRGSFPRTSRRKHVDEMVRRLFEKNRP